MATIKEIIERVDETRPNSFTEKVKLQWLSELEGKIAADVMLMGIEEIRALQYKHPDSMETEPLVTYPHQDIYVYWLEAKIDYANGEYNKYQNSMEMYNQHYQNFARWYASTYEPVLRRWSSLENPPYFSIKAGLTAAEAQAVGEWLDGINGEVLDSSGMGALMEQSLYNDIRIKLTGVSGAKEQITQAIEAKGVTVPEGTVFREYDSLIGQIETEGLKAVAVTFKQEGNVVTETSTLEDGTQAQSTITFDDNGNPLSISAGDESVQIEIGYDENGYASSITVNGEACPVGWEGFV